MMRSWPIVRHLVNAFNRAIVADMRELFGGFMDAGAKHRDIQIAFCFSYEQGIGAIVKVAAAKSARHAEAVLRGTLDPNETPEVRVLVASSMLSDSHLRNVAALIPGPAIDMILDKPSGAVSFAGIVCTLAE